MSESTVLTDVENGEFQESCRISAGNGSIFKTTLRGGLSEGVDLVELHNGDLSISVLPTRGMGIWKC